MGDQDRPSGTVLQVHTKYRRPGGEDVVVSNLNDALSAAGWQVDLHEARNPSGARALAQLGRATWNQQQGHALREHVSSLRPDLTHIHNTWFAMSPSVIDEAHRLGPVVMTLHNYRITCANALLFRAGEVCERCVTGSPWTGFWLNCYRDPFSSLVAAATVAKHRKRETWNHSVDRYFALSNFAAELFARAGVERDRIEVVNNHVADPGDRAKAPSESDFVLYVGRLSEEKGIVALADRWIRFAPADLRLVICGEGPLADSLPEHSSLVVRGWTPPAEVAELMLNARALIFPSLWYEGQPLTILEAFAAGLPVLGSHLGGTAELLEFLGPEWSPRHDSDDQWQRGFDLLATDAVDAASEAARNRFLADHTERVVIDRVIAGYRRAIEDRSR